MTGDAARTAPALATALPDRTPAHAAPTPSAPPILRRWDAQQAAYIADRERRFAVMLDVIALTVGERPTVVDLACGPGSLSLRVLERFPHARVVGIDYDPLLLRIAEQALAPFGERAALIDADLTDDRWPRAVGDRLGGEPPQAAVSTTALHWLAPHELARVYAQAARLLAPGGVLLNGDHLRFDDRHPTLRRIADQHDQATQRRGFGDRAPTWDAWWAEARAALADGSELAAERERRFAGRDRVAPTTVGFHVSALTQAGFAEAAPVWQLLDDYVVFGRRPNGASR